MIAIGWYMTCMLSFEILKLAIILGWLVLDHSVPKWCVRPDWVRFTPMDKFLV